MIKGFQPHNNPIVTVFIVLFTAETVGVAGYVGGFYNKEGRLDFLTFQWDLESLIYTILLWCSWLLLLTLIVRSKEELGTKVGASVLASLPVSIFCFLLVQSLLISDISYSAI